MRPAANRDIFTGVQITEPATVLADDCDVRCIDPRQVASTRARLIDVDHAQAMADTFKLLSDPHRLRLVDALADAGELCVCDLAAVTDRSETSVSQVMRLLRAAGVVRNRRDGRIVYYRLDDDHIRALLDQARAHAAEDAAR